MKLFLLFFCVVGATMSQEQKPESAGTDNVNVTHANAITETTTEFTERCVNSTSNNCGATVTQEQKPVGLGYDDTLIRNPTDFTATVHIHYESAFCADANPVIAPGQRWSESRGVCLICEITALMQKGDKVIRAKPYGPLAVCTGFADFAIVKSGVDSFDIVHT